MKASLRSSVDPFRAMDVMAKANQMAAAGERVISLAVGQPAAPAPSLAIGAARAMLEHGRIAYTDALGRMELRERIARHYGERYGQSIGAERVMVTTGSSAGFNLAFIAAFDPGDRVAIAAPGYPAYRNILKALGLEPVEIEVSVTDGYVLDADRLAAEHALKPLQGVLIASPSNPTGTVTPRETLRELIAFADREGIRFISDEIYHGLVYGEAEATALEFSDSPIIVNSFSKYYCMTGWRVGWLVLPPSLVRAAERLGQNLYISAPELSQAAALAVFDATDELESIKAGYRQNRDLMMERLPQLGFSQIAPIDGAFYAYAAIPPGQGTASEWSARLLEQAHVALTMGVDFDLRRGEAFARLSYACSHAELVEALDRIAAQLA
ncbi:pyridoxal phosphate-dependent aminotransferase [Consotaella aegiceratis]|uniref:pyridoxal phosphate-dependent aminotransferase n=1 Tax=Consotaella aegiceratis TaxID=3097961 RepID=UPI002F3EA2B2